ncbi:glycosyltransferase [Roseococcus pinisoli]|uniref:Glycosyltransferase n=1 Tax=Roseococcus pinisoli TaxID=2835040 RepID=A0ABS5QIJ1_9PROT|nr:glycosyltransferase [Roseococcus pinisoli]MBS7813499.1 glycosyltransferase [Roseococcus pinisoli]
MIRLANIMAGARHGGAEAFFERLTLALHGAGDEVLPVIRRDPERAARLAEGGLPPFELRFGGPLDVMTRPRLGLLLKSYRPLVSMVWMNRAAAKTPGGPWPTIGRLGGYYDLKYYTSCDHLVGNTRDLRDWIVAQGCPAENAHYLPNFVSDLADAAPADLPGAAPRVLAMGRLHRNKGFDVAIRALALVPEATLCIAGEGPEREALTALARECGVADRVHLLGWRTDIGALLAGSDVFLCSSRHEPLGNIVLEAWSASRPVVAAAAQGPRELIVPNETGLLVPVEAPEAMADALRAVLADRAAAAGMAERARKAFETDFAEAPVLAQWRDFLHKVQR